MVTHLVSELVARRSLIGCLLTPAVSGVSVEFLEAVRQQVQKFQVQYVGNLPVCRAMGRTPVTPVTPVTPEPLTCSQ